ncbi:unnamed protein product [marine sediment metagenome]|uniref:Transcription regulator PadR N-terminal domain-containing protein n=1 Tax=marine sediment metagenome TaxID=412755 RepID=X0WX00_9ZZZZ
MLDTVVLRVLCDGDNYGFGIMQHLMSRLGDDGAVLKGSTVYPLLHRLEDRGYVESYWRSGKRGTDRKYYRITKAGRACLTQRKKDWRQVARIVRRLVLSH